MKPITTTYKPAPVSVLDISEFKGIDLYNSPSNVEVYRSPDAPNMIRDEVGKVRKRIGYYHVKTYDGAINGVHFFGTTKIVHAGTKLYIGDTAIYTSMNNNRSKSWQLSKKLFIMDGKEFLVYGEFDGSNQLKKVSDVAYIPKIIINRTPTGGGTTLEPINLLQSKWTEEFLGTSTGKDYQLTTGGLDATLVTAQKLNSDGSWTNLSETTHFTVDRTIGKVTFITAPGVTPITGEGNVRITASKDRTGYKDKINKCDISILYGVNGAADRIFASGNPDFPNYDWYSQMNDPTYFGDTWYSILGSDNSPIMGYSIAADRLTAHKQAGDDGRNAIMRSGTLLENQAAFPIVATLQGEGAISKYAFAYLQNEPLFLTKLGVYAITPADITGERYAQGRSFYIDKALQEEANIQSAVGFSYNNFYFLAINGNIYILDGLQKTYERNAPQSAFQYECYLWKTINVRLFWEENGELHFGNSGGQVFSFYSDSTDQESFNDNEEPIEAYWELPDIDGKAFYKNKTFKHISSRLASAVSTGVKIYVQKKGVWYEIYDSQGRARYFSWSRFNWAKFTWSGDSTPRTLNSKIKVKRVDKARYRLLNNELNEPFGLYHMALEYTVDGDYEG